MNPQLHTNFVAIQISAGLKRNARSWNMCGWLASSETSYSSVASSARRPTISISALCIGTIRIFRSTNSSMRSGVQNWTRERMDAAIGYAANTGKTKPSVLSNNFSLAAMVQPVWAGCIASSDAAWKEWLSRRGVRSFAWSRQARGFFTDRAGAARWMTRNWRVPGTRKATSPVGTGHGPCEKIGQRPFPGRSCLCSLAAGAGHSADRSSQHCGTQPQSRSLRDRPLAGRCPLAGRRDK
jgi:hypothetical protein